MKRKRNTYWMGYFLNLCNPHFYSARVPLKTAKEACMMFSVPNLVAWTQLKHQTLHHTPTLILMNLHIRHTDTGQKNHYGGKAATISPMHHPTGQVNHRNGKKYAFSVVQRKGFCFKMFFGNTIEIFPNSLILLYSNFLVFNRITYHNCNNYFNVCKKSLHPCYSGRFL